MTLCSLIRPEIARNIDLLHIREVAVAAEVGYPVEPRSAYPEPKMLANVVVKVHCSASTAINGLTSQHIHLKTILWSRTSKSNCISTKLIANPAKSAP